MTTGSLRCVCLCRTPDQTSAVHGPDTTDHLTWRTGGTVRPPTVFPSLSGPGDSQGLPVHSGVPGLNGVFTVTIQDPSS